ncbi:Chemotaxis response regulator protein-glutamate methylesterase [Thalassocella blandensis]|nr:Chemotaxis response regulator protein-glutamate methylesterase [Thalassocella blandensis]
MTKEITAQPCPKKNTIDLTYPPFQPVFCIGASAGGVKALQSIAESLPENFSCPVFFLLHRKRENGTHIHLLNSIIEAKSHLVVETPQNGDIVQGGHIYLPPKDRHILVDDNQIIFSEHPADTHWRPSINVLFKSIAREYTERAVSILLTGKLDDGVDGLIETTLHGGITVAQSPEDAYEPMMPLNALLKDHPHYVLPLHDIPALMCELAQIHHFPNQKNVIKDAALAARTKHQNPNIKQPSTQVNY